MKANNLILCKQNFEDMASDKNTIGDNIKKLRAKLNLTQDDLARKSDLPYTTLTKIETNVITKPSIQTVMKMAKGLGIGVDDLMK